MRGLITLVNGNHVDNAIKEILAFVYYGSTGNNRPKNYPKLSPYLELCLLATVSSLPNSIYKSRVERKTGVSQMVVFSQI